MDGEASTVLHADVTERPTYEFLVNTVNELTRKIRLIESTIIWENPLPNHDAKLKGTSAVDSSETRCAAVQAYCAEAARVKNHSVVDEYEERFGTVGPTFDRPECTTEQSSAESTTAVPAVPPKTTSNAVAGWSTFKPEPKTDVSKERPTFYCFKTNSCVTTDVLAETLADDEKVNVVGAELQPLVKCTTTPITADDAWINERRDEEDNLRRWTPASSTTGTNPTTRDTPKPETTTRADPMQRTKWAKAGRLATKPATAEPVQEATGTRAARRLRAR